MTVVTFGENTWGGLANGTWGGSAFRRCDRTIAGGVTFGTGLASAIREVTSDSSGGKASDTGGGNSDSWQGFTVDNCGDSAAIVAESMLSLALKRSSESVSTAGDSMSGEARRLVSEPGERGACD